MDSQLQLLTTLNFPGCYIAYNIEEQTAVIHNTESDCGDCLVPKDELLMIFVNGWISRYSTDHGKHFYHLTDGGRMEINAIS